MIIAALLAATLVVPPQTFAGADIRHFPSEYFDTEVRPRLERRALTSWPGPTGLAAAWRSGELNTNQQMILLIGAGAFHDPQLLPIYIEGVRSPTPELRAAAVYGYRVLLADRVPNVRAGVTPEQGEMAAKEMRAMAASLATNSLAEMWAASALAADGVALTGYSGIVLHRRAADCLMSMERVIWPEDLATVVLAYRSAAATSSRLAFLKLLEGLALRRFLSPFVQPNTPWDESRYDDATALADEWLAGWERDHCEVVADEVLSASFRDLGVTVSQPLAPHACALWGAVVDKGDSAWWTIASRQLYLCGGPPVELSIIRSDQDETRNQRDFLVRWYDLRPQDPEARDRRPKPTRKE